MTEFDQASAQAAQHAKRHRYCRAIAAAFAVGVAMAVCSGVYAIKATRTAAAPIAAERINPNTAPAASLMRLPGIGRVRAADIVTFRQARPDGRPAFSTPDDLQQIRGIGPVTAERAAPYLTFEEQIAEITEDID